MCTCQSILNFLHMHTVYIPEVTVRVKLPFCDQPFDLWLPLLTSLLCKAYLHIEGEGKKRLVSQSKTQKDIVRLSTFHFVHGRAIF